MSEKEIKTLNFTETAKYVDIHKRKLYRMLKDGSFNAEPIKGTNPRLWRTDVLDAWMNNDGK